MDINQELAEFLMNDLAETYDEFDDASMFAYSVITNIAILGNEINESMAKMYLAPVVNVVDADIVYATMSYFHGSNILKVQCDCTPSHAECFVNQIESSDWFHAGVEEESQGSPMYNLAVSDVMALRTALY